MFPVTMRAPVVRVVVAVGVVVGVVGVVAAPAPAASPGRLRAPGQVGTVDTVAGPGFCDGPATPDPASTVVGAVAADAASGSLWYETGLPEDGRVTTVLNTSFVLAQRIASPSTGTAGPVAAAPTVRSASRLASDGRGGLFIAQPTAVLRSSQAGGLVPVAGTASPPPAGTPTAEAFGDGGPVQAARFGQIAAIAADTAGNVYVADQVAGSGVAVVIRFLNLGDGPVTFFAGTPREVRVAAGTVGTIAGSVSPDGSPVGGAAVEVVAPALAVADGRLYVAGSSSGTGFGAELRMLNVGGVQVRAHGAVVEPGAWVRIATVDGAQDVAVSAGSSVSAVPGIAADTEGNVFWAERANHRIRRVDAAGTVSTVAGTGTAGFDGNDRPAVQARLDGPVGVAVGAGGRLFVSDAGNAQVRVVDRAGTIRAALGNGAALSWICEVAGGATAAPPVPRPVTPVDLVADASGNVYVASTRLDQFVGVGVSGTLPAVPVLEPVGGGPSRALGAVWGVTAGPGGGLFFRDQVGVYVWNLGRSPLALHGRSIAPGTVAAVVGSAAVVGGATGGSGGKRRGEGDGGSALDATLSSKPGGALALDGRGNVWLSDPDPDDPLRGRVRQVDPQGKITTVLEGSGRAADGSVDTVRCCGPVGGLIADSAGNLYIADASLEVAPLVDGIRSGVSLPLGRVWFVNRSPAPVLAHGVTVPPGEAGLVAGAAVAGSDQDGVPARQARLPSAGALALDASGNLYVLSTADHTVRRVDPGGLLTTAVGTGQAGFNGDELKGPLTSLDGPTDLVIDACGNLLVADSGNDRVRRLTLLGSCPSADLPAAAPPPPGRALPAAAAAAVGVVVLLAFGVWWVVSARRGGRARRAAGRGNVRAWGRGRASGFLQERRSR